MNKNFDVSCLITEIPELTTATEDLIYRIPDKDKCIKLVFFGKLTSNISSDLAVISGILPAFFKVIPLISFIPQPLGGNAAFGVEITKLTDPDTCVSYRENDNIRYAICENNMGKFLLLDGIFSDDCNISFEEKCTAVFLRIGQLLTLEGFCAGEIVRQWNYIGQITHFDAGNQHYQVFNNARTAYYLQDDFAHGYPAATGISLPDDCLIISLIALQKTSGSSVIPVDNHWQIPAYSYSGAVLVDGKSLHFKTTPKFERAKLLLIDGTADCFVSGTAAIRNEHSLCIADVVPQTRQTIENINFLISGENLRLNNCTNAVDLHLNSIRVYIKNPEDYPAVKSEVETAWPGLNAIYLLADICRPELLVEIEGVAS